MSRLHPEKPWNGAEGRGFDSRQLHRLDLLSRATHAAATVGAWVVSSVGR